MPLHRAVGTVRQSRGFGTVSELTVKPRSLRRARSRKYSGSSLNRDPT